jgi:cytochrome c-type biogenesis protein CcmH/NrfF
MTTDSATIDIDRLQASFKVKNAELRCPVCSSEDMVLLDPAMSVPQVD